MSTTQLTDPTLAACVIRVLNNCSSAMFEYLAALTALSSYERSLGMAIEER